jgi:hypothetical protein
MLEKVARGSRDPMWPLREKPHGRRKISPRLANAAGQAREPLALLRHS